MTSDEHSRDHPPPPKATEDRDVGGQKSEVRDQMAMADCRVLFTLHIGTSDTWYDGHWEFGGNVSRPSAWAAWLSLPSKQAKRKFSGNLLCTTRADAR